MATTTTTKTFTVKITTYTSAVVTYSVSTSETSVSMSIKSVKFTNSRSSGFQDKIYVIGYVAIDSLPDSGSTEFLRDSNTINAGVKAKTFTTSYTRSWTRGKSTATHAVNLDIGFGDYPYGYDYYYSKTVSFSVSVPAKPSYKVTLNANGGSGGTASLTKWYNESLTLPNPTLSGFTAPARAGWKFLGYHTNSTSTTTLSQIAASSNIAQVLYAVWERQITGITLDVHTLRVADGASTVESDDGTWCYGTCSYTVTGAAAGELTLRVSTSSPGVQILQSEYIVTKSIDQTLSGTIAFRASNCSTELSHVFTVSAQCSNTSATQSDVTKSASDTLSLAFFTMDILGDAYLFNLTTDASIDYNKTYYQLVDGSYQAIPVSELQQDLLYTYYEKNGSRPGHGISFGAPCKDEGFHVAMPADFGDGVAITGNLSLGGETMPDFVVAQGTSGIWTYRKWHSGIMECWGTYTASMAINVTSGPYGGYRSAQITAPAYPFAFTAQPVASAIVSYNSQGAWVNNGGGTASNFMYYLSCGASLAAASRSVSIHAIGRWK